MRRWVWRLKRGPAVRPLGAQSPRCAFSFGFPKNGRSNIDKDEAEALKKLAAHLLSLMTRALAQAQGAGELIEADCDAKDEISDP